MNAVGVSSSVSPFPDAAEAQEKMDPTIASAVEKEKAGAAKTAKLVEPKSFSEKSFSQYIIDLCAAGRHRAAENYYLKNVRQLLDSKINGKEKLNHLIYLPRIIQSGGGTKHGYQKLRIKAAGVERAIKGLALPKGGAFIELGCGAHDPLALPTYFYLNGFEPCYGIDLLPPRTEYYSALSMYDICVNVRAFPRFYARPGVEPKDVLPRLKPFHLTRFEQGSLAGGFGAASDKIKFLQEDICQADIKKESCSLIVSFAVLEHVTDISRVAQTLYDLLLPGGVVYHFVDLADHRSYRGDGAFGPLSFLADEVAPPNMNRLRAPQITEAHVAAGFEILRDSRESVEMPDEILKNLQPRFREFSPEDVSVIKQSLILRKPGIPRA